MALQIQTILAYIVTLIESVYTSSKNSGKLKQMKVKMEKNSAKEEQPDRNPDNKAGAVDQIKKKYGFSSAGVSTHLLPIF